MGDITQIINEIKAGITQDSYGDQVRYLQKRIQEFSDYPDAKVIEREC